MGQNVFYNLWLPVNIETNLSDQGLVVECGNFPCLLALKSVTFSPSYQSKMNGGHLLFILQSVDSGLINEQGFG